MGTHEVGSEPKGEEQLLKNLHLSWMAETIDREVAQALKEKPAYEAFLTRLLRAQYHHQQEMALAYRIRQAHLPEKWTIESFPFKQQPSVNPQEICSFAELDFISKGENIVLIGPTGVGKTGLASGILLKALQNGYRGLFIRAQDLFDEMYASLADRSSRKLVDRLARIDLIVCDELGYLNLRPEQTNIFFKLMEERYNNRRPTIITASADRTNIEYTEWHGLLGNPALVEALLSRLRHRCHTVHIEGPSLREPQG